MAKEEYEVEKIVGDRVIKGKVQYKVRWIGYAEEDDTWENESQLDCSEILEEYLQEKNDEPTTSKKKESSSKRNSKAKRKKQGDSDNESENSGEPRKGQTKKNSKVKGKKEDHDSGNNSGSDHEDQKKVESKKKPMSLGTKEDPQEISDSEHEDEYVVEEIMEMRLHDGRTQYRVRWQGFGPEDDTWEDESNLNCPEALATFRAKEFKDKGKGSKKKAAKKRGRPSAGSKGKDEEPLSKTAKEGEDHEDENGNEYEVDKILDMHIYRDGTRSFLVKWLGYSKDESTWEPEKNLKGTAVLERYLANVEKSSKKTQKLKGKNVPNKRKPKPNEPKDEMVDLFDENSIFGEHIASKLRKYSEQTRSIVEHLISDILFKADMGSYTLDLPAVKCEPIVPKAECSSSPDP